MALRPRPAANPSDYPFNIVPRRVLERDDGKRRSHASIPVWAQNSTSKVIPPTSTFGLTVALASVTNAM
jgi:hypothetical protein